jgi:hypothetical protein
VSRFLLGAAAGVAATAAMTVAMRALFPKLPERSRYPLPPRELIEAVDRGRTLLRAEEGRRRATTLAHLGYGALAGGLFALANDRPSATDGALYGVAVWAGSYLGWIPATRLLRPATSHPLERNVLMLAAHVVWGVSVVTVLREFEHAERLPFAGDDAPDLAHPKRPSTALVQSSE